MCKSHCGVQSSLRAWKITGPNKLSLFSDHCLHSNTVLPDRLRVEPLFIGICGSDLELLKKGGAHSSHAGETKPIIPGHELCAKVVEVGADVKRFQVGDIVVVEPALPCKNCPNCLRGNYHTCKSTGYWATPPVDGCFAGLMDVLPEYTFKVPKGLDPMVACLTEPLAACVQAVYSKDRGKLAVDRKEWTLIIGGGNIAMGVLFVLRRMAKVENIIVAARSTKDLEFAKKLGAKHVVHVGDEHVTHGAMAEIVKFTHGGVMTAFECTGANDMLKAAARHGVMLGTGKIIAVGCQYGIELDMAWFRRPELQLFTVRRSCNKFPKTIKLLAEHTEEARSLVGRIGTFEELGEVLTAHGGTVIGDGPKTVIDCRPAAQKK